MDLALAANPSGVTAGCQFHRCLSHCNHSKQLFVAKTVHTTNEPETFPPKEKEPVYVLKI